MPRRKAPVDIFMQFGDLSVDLDGADTSVLVEGVKQTGLSVRGHLIWLVHLIEVFLPLRAYATPMVLDWALSTISGLAAMPQLGDRGLVARCSLDVLLTTSGVTKVESPRQLKYLPPIPLATPELSIYGQMDADEAAFRDVQIGARVGFTTAPLDQPTMTEIVEVWGY